jgi:hypothetical protein
LASATSRRIRVASQRAPSIVLSTPEPIAVTATFGRDDIKDARLVGLARRARAFRARP